MLFICHKTNTTKAQVVLIVISTKLGALSVKTLDFEGTLPPGGETFLGPVFNIDVSRPIRSALLSTETEPRGLFLVEHPRSPRADDRQPTAVVTVVQVSHIEETLARAEAFGAPVSETETAPRRTL